MAAGHCPNSLESSKGNKHRERTTQQKKKRENKYKGNRETGAWPCSSVSSLAMARAPVLPLSEVSSKAFSEEL